MYVTPLTPDEVSGHMADSYAHEQQSRGYVPNYTRLFSLHPDAYAAWQSLGQSIRRRMPLRRYELATLAAAAALGCRYCVSAHAAAAIGAKLFSREQLITILRDRRTAGLEPVEVALMDLAAQVALDASKVDQRHIKTLREHGLSDTQVFDVVLAAAARSFFSKTLDAMGARPDDGLAATNDLLDVVEPVGGRQHRCA